MCVEASFVAKGPFTILAPIRFSARVIILHVQIKFRFVGKGLFTQAAAIWLFARVSSHVDLEIA